MNDKAIMDNNSENKITRIYSLDLARFFAMMMMIQGHTIYAIINPELLNYEDFGWNVWNFLRGLTAPAFIFISGIVHVFANKRKENGSLKLSTIFKRFYLAIGIIVIGYMLVLPAQNIFDLPYVSEEVISQFTIVNILQLFGVSLIMLLISYITTKNDRQLKILSYIISSIILIISIFAWQIDWFVLFPEFIAQYFTSAGGSYFPIFPFTAYLFLGTIVGLKIKSIHPDGTKKYFERTLPQISITILIVSIISMYMFKLFLPDYDFNSINNPIFSIYRLGYVIIGIILFEQIYRKFKKQISPFTSMSKKALFIYVLHLFVIYGTAYTKGVVHIYPGNLNTVEAILAAFMVLLFTMSFTYIMDLIFKKVPYSSLIFQILVFTYIFMRLFI